MKNNFLKHFFIIGSGTFISMFIGFLTTPIITRIVSPVDYGQYSIFTMYSNIALMVLCIGLDQALVRYFYETKMESSQRALMFKCLKIPIIGTVIVTIIVLALAKLGVFIFELGFSVLSLLCVYTLVQIIYRFSQLLIRLQYKSKLYSLLGIIQKSVYVILALGLIHVGVISDSLSLEIATAVGAVVCLFISIWAEHKLWNPLKIQSGDCSVTQRELIQYAYPYVFTMGLTTLFQYIDKISLNYYCSYEQVGIYASTMTLVNIFAIIQNTFNTLWAPMAVEHYTKDKTDVFFYQSGNQIITVIMFFVGLSLIFLKDIFATLLGEKYRDAAYILPFLIFNPIMYTISETTVNGLVFMKKSKMQVVVSIGACMTNVIGNIILVPKFGCQGAAISTGLSYIVFFTLRTVLSNKYYYVDFKLKRFYLLTIVAVLYAFYNTFVKFNTRSIVGYFVCVTVLILLYKDTILFILKYIQDMVLNIVNNHK